MINLSIKPAASPQEWEAVKTFRNTVFFDPLGIQDPYTWTFDDKNHHHFLLYKDDEITGYSHIQYWPKARAAMRMIAINEIHQSKGLGSIFLDLCERWLKTKGYQSLHAEARPSALRFYQKNGYTQMPFGDEITESPDIAVGKNLC